MPDSSCQISRPETPAQIRSQAQELRARIQEGAERACGAASLMNLGLHILAHPEDLSRNSGTVHDSTFVDRVTGQRYRVSVGVTAVGENDQPI